MSNDGYGDQVFELTYLEPKQKREPRAHGRNRSYFEQNVGKIVTTHQLSDVAGIRDYQRHIRELRDEEVMQIRPHVDLHTLKPGEYLLETLDRAPAVEHSISPQIRAEILERDGFTCRQCGVGAGDLDEFNPGRKVRLQVDHIKPLSQGGNDDCDNLRALCSACSQGNSNIQTPTENAFNLLACIRKQPRSVQREIYEQLKRSFADV